LAEEKKNAGSDTTDCLTSEDTVQVKEFFKNVAFLLNKGMVSKYMFKLCPVIRDGGNLANLPSPGNVFFSLPL
jgi:hypothetical protein